MIASVLLLAVCSSMIAATQPATELQDVAQFILSRVSLGETNKMLFYVWGPVLPQETILTTKESLFNIPSSGYVMYIDLYPMANLFHPVKYVFCAKETGSLTIFDVNAPPLNFQDYSLIKTPFSQMFFSVENRRAPLPETSSSSQQVSSDDSRWAVLMNGGYDASNNHVRYWNDLSNIYVTLNHIYDIPDENIIVLCSDGLNPAVDQSNGQNSNPDLDGDGDNDIMYSCILSNVNLVFAGLAANFTGSEKLFVFTTDHGDSVSGWNVVENLWNHEELTDAHFAELLAALPECEVICTFEPCFSGGFLDNVVVPPGPVVASSACSHDEYSYAMSDLVYDEYVFHWTAAVTGKDAHGTTVDADANQDGIITMDEAYLYAEAHDTQPENPQYGDYPEDIGSSLSLWVSSPPPAQPTKPSGPVLGIWNSVYTYTSTTTEPENEQIYYRFNWDDGTNSGWVGPYNSGETGMASHTWTELGTYNVTVKAKDIHGSGSVLSEPLTVVITDNQPPNIPTITGPNQIKPRIAYTYTLSGTDNQSQNLTYYVDWGDGNGATGIGPYRSGETFTLTHTWKNRGTYVIRVRTTDTAGATSPWATVQVITPKEYSFTLGDLLKNLFDRYPHLFPFIRQVLGY